VKVDGPQLPQSMRVSPHRCSPQRCIPVSPSQGNDHFANQILSAMRKGFGGHDEKGG